MVAPACSAAGSASPPPERCPTAASSRGSAPGRDSTALAVVPAMCAGGFASRVHPLLHW